MERGKWLLSQSNSMVVKRTVSIRVERGVSEVGSTLDCTFDRGMLLLFRLRYSPVSSTSFVDLERTSLKIPECGVPLAKCMK